MYKRILVATDLSEASENALAYGADWAARDGAELHVVYVDVPRKRTVGEGLREVSVAAGRDEESDEAARSMLAQLEFPPRLTVTRKMVSGVSASSAILDYAVDNDIDLIVVGSHTRSGLGRFLLGGVLHEVVRLARAPVLVVGSGDSHAPPVGGELRILAPIDFSEASKASLRTAQEISASRGGQLFPVHAIDLTRLPPYFELAIEGAQREEVRQGMRELLEEVGAAPDAEPIVCEGPAAWKVLEAARENRANLIVIGTTGHGLLRSLLIGSVAERVLKSVICPILVVRDPAERASEAAAQRTAA